MTMQKSELAIPVAEFAAALLATQAVVPRAQVTAHQVAEILPGIAVVVYVVEDQDNPAWSAKATAGDITVAAVIEFREGTLGTVADSKTSQLFERDLKREYYAHLDVRRTVVSLAYIPLLVGEVLVGAIELVNCEASFPMSMLARLHDIADLAAPAIAAALAYERERNASLHSISRVTQMYDLEKVFNSTLEMDELLEIITKKFQEVMNVQGVNLWMINGDVLELTRCAGVDPTVQVGRVENPGEGIAGDISENGEPVLIPDPLDERLQKRNLRTQGEGVFSLVAAPLLEQEKLVGVVEVVNRLDGAPFDEDDQFLLNNICQTATNALHNASLLQAERKLEILQTLVEVSAEITSTLNLDGVLEAIVNRPAAVIPYERSAVALESRGKLQLKAISGMDVIVPGDREVSRLRSLLEWASISGEEIFITQKGDKINTEREQTRAKFEEYFSQTGMRAFFSIPLTDDDGRLGIYSLESSDPDFLTPAHLEMVRIMAAQATVALRNASLYREVPLISVLEPILEKKRKFLALEKRRRMLIFSVAAAVLLFLAICPFPLRVMGNAIVEPGLRLQVGPQVAGVLENIYVHEGDRVRAGQVLAKLEDWNYRDALSADQAKYEIALAEMNRALAASDGGTAGVQREQAQYWASEVDRAKTRLQATYLRAPIDGWVATPHVEDFKGRELSPGDKFVEIVDNSRATVDVAISEEEFGLLRSGLHGSVKLDSFPLQTYTGSLGTLSPKAETQGDDQVFFARLAVANPKGLLRAGMQGRAKIFVGWYPVGYVWFRQPGVWAYRELWSWFGW